MAEFEKAVEFVLQNEGGFVNNPNDSGGATNFGISLRFLREVPVERLRKYGFMKDPHDLDLSDIESMTLDQAKLIYKGEFWDVMPFERIRDQPLTNYVFDCCVLHGISIGIKLFQRALWAVSIKRNCIHDDGILGDETLMIVNNEIYFYPLRILIALIAERAGYCRLIASERSKDKEFLDGWLNRCYRI